MKKKIDPSFVWSDVQAIRKLSPLIHNITNYVVMEQTANSLLAIGASPVMAHALEEVKEMIMIANSLVLNMGTLSFAWIEGMKLAIQAANCKGVPIVFDPVGVGATPYRLASAQALLEMGSVAAIRGNASEIFALNGASHTTKGVDSCLDPMNCIKQAQALACDRKCIVTMSGPVDVVTNGQTVFLVHQGDPLMGTITGMGCTATALMGAFLAINENSLMASLHTMIVMGIVGELAAKESTGPGSFKVAFIDKLHHLSFADIQESLRAVELL